MDDSFVKAPVAVPRLSGFDKSHQNLFTSKVGTITPVLVDELIPGSKVNLKMALSASLPPLASDTFMRCSIKAEAFFVPMRLLCASFESFFTDQARRYYDAERNPVELKGQLPVICPTSAQSAGSFMSFFSAPGTLPDYLGMRNVASTGVLTRGVSAMPFLAYHRIYHDWYRNTLVQRDVFLPNRPMGADYFPQDSVLSVAAASAPYDFFSGSKLDATRAYRTVDQMRLADGVSLLELRQRNFDLDYFTTATPQPQQGSAEVVKFDTSGDEGQFSIATLRAANSMQQFKERNNLLGNLYVEQLFGRYGVRPSDGIAQRSIYLGRGEFEVYSKGVYQTSTPYASDNELIDSETGNPFNNVAARYGSAYASGDSFVVNFEAKEPGYLFVMCTLVPRVTYSSGIDKLMTRYVEDGSLAEMANPILQNVGPEPIYDYELTGRDSSAIFGYTDRYASFKTKQDTLHGLVRDGNTLAAFALQRSFEDAQTLGSQFLQIPTDYMDQVTAVEGWLSQYGYWCDCYFNYRVAMPLSKYSLPSLQDPAYEHGRTLVVDKGGSKL